MKLRLGLGVSLAAVMAASPLVEPRLTAFPYDRRIGTDHIYSATPIDETRIRAILGRANALVEASPIHIGTEGRNIYLTDGGWRWKWLAGRSQGAFALTRTLGEPVIVNRADLQSDHVYNGAAIGGTRTLSGVIAHEKCHGMVRRHFGLMRERLAPNWLREGYCDYVARESSLTDAQTRELEAAHSSHPALIYAEGRKTVAAKLAANGGSVDELFGSAH